MNENAAAATIFRSAASKRLSGAAESQPPEDESDRKTDGHRCYEWDLLAFVYLIADGVRPIKANAT
ncbi:MAG: hypothetical protein ACRD4O_14090 [Bryobacteraceae bacterium]